MTDTKKIRLLAGLLCGLFAFFMIFLHSGRLIMVDGCFSFILWLMPIAAAAVLIDNRLLSPKTAAVMMVIYIIVMTGMRSHKPRMIAEERTGGCYYALYELNPGAMGHTSYRLTKYYELAGCRIYGKNLLNVRLCLSSERYRYLDGVPALGRHDPRQENKQ